MSSGSVNDSVTYSLTMEYDVMSNPLKKVQEISGSEVASSHDLTYLYGGEKPNAATQIGEDKYTYDMNGNPTLIENDSTSRQMRWDEENRLTMVNDDGYVSRYTYDHAGVRTVKSHGPLEGVAINGAAQGLDYHDKENYTIYVSPYMTVTADRFTKHYYAGTQRIASKIGGGDFDNVYGVESFHLTAGQKDYADRLVMMESGVQEYYKKSGIPPGPPTNKGQNADPYATDVALPNVPLGDYSVPSGWPTDPKFNAKGDVPGPPAMWQPEEDLSDPPAGYGFTPDSMPELEVFFFHTDHLGSTSYLTDTAGNVTQFVWYSPYGESIIDEHTTSYENPFKFNGKEIDEITGLYYYGARYLNPKTVRWLSIDPLCEDYEQLSPYSVCAGRPIVLKDEEGEWLNFVVGAALGAVVEYGAQVAGNMIQNGVSASAFYENIDIADIGIAAIEGAVTSGASVSKNLAIKATVNVTSTLVQSKFDLNVKDGKVEGEIKDNVETIKNASIEIVVGKASDKTLGKVIKNKATVSPMKTYTSKNKAVKAATEKKGSPLTKVENNNVRKNFKSNNRKARHINKIVNENIQGSAGTVAGNVVNNKRNEK